jgi:Big-like domain-containing protein
MTETQGWGLLQFRSALNKPIAGLSTRGFPSMSSSRRKIQLVASFSLLLLIAAISVGCNGFFVDPILQTITVGPTGVGILVGKTQQMTAIGTYDDGSQKNITGSTGTTWTTNDQTISTVTPGGLVTGVGAGNATVTATQGVATGSASITVSLNGVTSIAVTPSSQSVSATGGVPFCLVATATPGGDISTLNSTTWAFTNSTTNLAVTGITKTNTGCTTGQAWSIGTLSPSPPITVNVTASAPSGTGGTVTSPSVTVNITP